MGSSTTTSVAVAILALLGVVACGDDDARPEDAAADAGLDAVLLDGPAPSSEAGREAGPTCDPGCELGDRCCAGSDGIPQCIDPRTSEEHCGLCGIACAEGRGTACVGGFCACGATPEGCTGTRRDTCCPEPSGGQPSCRNLDTDPGNCGGCGVRCDVRRATSCRNGNCECGDLRHDCDGTDVATCCVDAVGVGLCRDLTRDPSHCGACNNRCPFGFRCLGGVCSLDGEPCPPGCAFPDACCRGECCDPSLCRADGCMGT